MRDIHDSHILLIGAHADPDPDVWNALASLNSPILYTNSVDEVIALLLEHNIVLIMIDVESGSLPEKNDALMIRGSDRFKHLPIVFLFPENPPGDWKMPLTREEGPVDFLLKPLNRFFLEQKVALFVNYCQGKGINEELEKANEELHRLTENLEEAIEKANKAAVEAEMATITKSGFLASMSHEIRTPLNALIGFTDLVMGTPLNDEQREYMESIRSASNTFLELINDILDFSKIEADMVSLESIPFVVEDCVNDVVGTLWMKAREKNLEIGYRIFPDVPERVCGDPVRFKQIMMNLVGNAIKFTSVGQVIVRVMCETKDERDCVLRLSVSDSGIGIPETKWDQLFQPFSQVSESTTREYGGTGLGLAISKKLVELMGGDIWIESPNPESVGFPGTRFHVRARFAPDEEKHDRPTIHDSLYGRRVLVCEKNPVTLKLHCDILGDARMIPVPVNDPASLGRVLNEQNEKKRPISDILMGTRMADPLLDGLSRSFNGRIILMDYPDSQGDPVPASFDENRIARIRMPVRPSALYEALSNTPQGDGDTMHDHPDMDLTPHEGKAYKILLVEDNKINQKVTLKMLDRLGYQALLAENGRQAISIMDREKDVDLIIMDGQMPVMDGFKATEIIRRREKEGQQGEHIPIIALTANAMKGDERKFIESGMDDYIAKPVKLSALSQAISKAMDQQQARISIESSIEKKPDNS